MCEHDRHEDCMVCIGCNKCREDLNSNDYCMECGGVDENIETYITFCYQSLAEIYSALLTHYEIPWYWVERDDIHIPIILIYGEFELPDAQPLTGLINDLHILKECDIDTSLLSEVI